MLGKTKHTKILLSFIGSNDAGTLLENSTSEGAIITALENESFDQLILLWNENNYSHPTYAKIVKHLRKEIKKIRLVKQVTDYKMDISDVTNHNEIYSSIKEFVDELSKTENIKYTASVTSGTPAMQVCWILLGESGEFSENYPLRLIQVKYPRFGRLKNVEVNLDTVLPKIVGLRKEVESLKKDVVPIDTLNISRGELSIDDTSM